MTMKSADAFIQKMLKDEKFTQEVTAFKGPEDRMIFAKKSGFDFSPDEVKKAWEETSGKQLKLGPNANIGGISPLKKIQWTCCWYEAFSA